MQREADGLSYRRLSLRGELVGVKAHDSQPVQ